jgi:transposase
MVMGRTTTLEERVLICELSKAGHTDREIAGQMGWSKWTIRKWRRRGREGRKALVSEMGRPTTGLLSTFPASIRETVKGWREAHPGWGPKTLRAELEADERFKGQKLPCVRSIAAFLKQEELTRPYERHSELPQATRIAAVEAPHEVWEMDARGHELILDVGVVALINLNDRFSRLRLLSYPCLLGQECWTRSPATEDYQLALRLAFIDWGMPQTIQVDHEGVFYDNGTKSPFPTPIHRWLVALGISLTFGRKGCPSDQGLTENSHQLWDRQVLQGQTFADWDNLYHALRQRRDFLNTRLPCASLDEVPPLVAYPQAETSGRPYRPEGERELLDLERVYDYLSQGRWFRNAGKDGNTSIGGQYYLLGCKWEKQQVEITFDPSDQQLVFLAEDGERKQRHAIKGLTKESLMGELGPLVNLPAFQLTLPTTQESWRAVQHCCTLRA